MSHNFDYSWFVEEHAYCAICGKKMCHNQAIAGYDTRTGEPIMRGYLSCQSNVGRGIWSYHDRYYINGDRAGEKLPSYEVI